MGATTVDLGFLETEFESWEVESRHFPSKVGGRPAWLDMEHLPATQLLACPHCGQPRVFLLQVYAPDNSVADAFHRTLFVFICPRDECWGGQEDGAGPVLVLRSQLARDNPYYPSSPPEDGAGWRPDLVLGRHCALCAVCGARGDLRCGRCRAVSYCGQLHQKLDWRAGHKQQCGAEPRPSQAAFNLAQGLLVMEEEPDTEDGDPEEDGKYQHLVDQMAEGHCGLEAGAEEWEEVERGQKEDKTCERFKARLRRCPDQVLRYDRRGAPLLCSATPPAAPPPCPACGGPRSFELQVMPQLLTELRLGDTCQAGGVDWGSLHVYTCDASCHVARGYVAEHAAIQNYDLTNIPGS